MKYFFIGIFIAKFSFLFNFLYTIKGALFVKKNNAQFSQLPYLKLALITRV